MTDKVQRMEGQVIRRAVDLVGWLNYLPLETLVKIEKISLYLLKSRSEGSFYIYLFTIVIEISYFFR